MVGSSAVGEAFGTDGSVFGEKAGKPEEKPQGKRKVEFIENPLPLPKKHKKRVMDYKLDSERNLNGYDIYVPDDDDFDH